MIGADANKSTKYNYMCQLVGLATILVAFFEFYQMIRINTLWSPSTASMSGIIKNYIYQFFAHGFVWAQILFIYGVLAPAIFGILLKNCILRLLNFAIVLCFFFIAFSIPYDAKRVFGKVDSIVDYIAMIYHMLIAGILPIVLILRRIRWI